MNRKDFFHLLLGTLLIAFAYGLFFSLAAFINYIGGNESETGWLLGMSGVGAIVSVLYSKPLLHKVEARKLALIGSCFYALGSIGFLWVNQINYLAFILPMLLGIGWGFYYTAVPSLLSKSVSDIKISVYFSYLSAFTVLGAGLSPVILEQLWGNNIQYNYVFLGATCAALLAAVNFYLIRSSSISKVSLSQESTILKENVKKYRNIKVTYIYLMVFLGACVYTMLLNYQITFSEHIGSNYAYFYFLFSTTVVASRILLGKHIALLNQNIVTIFLLLLMILSLLLFRLSVSSILYGFSSVLFGLSYGLLYPTIQALAVKLTPISYRTDTISNFTLAYFLGVYAFPVLGGFLITYFGYDSLLGVLLGLSGFEWLLSLLLIL